MGGVPLTREEVKGFRHDWIYFMGFFSLLFFYNKIMGYHS